MQDKYLHPIAAKAGTRLRQQWQTNREKKADQELNGCGFCSCVPVFGLSVYFFSAGLSGTSFVLMSACQTFTFLGECSFGVSLGTEDCQ